MINKQQGRLGGELQTLICIEFTCQLIDKGDSAGTERSGARTHKPEAIRGRGENDREDTHVAAGDSAGIILFSCDNQFAIELKI